MCKQFKRILIGTYLGPNDCVTRHVYVYYFQFKFAFFRHYFIHVLMLKYIKIYAEMWCDEVLALRIRHIILWKLRNGNAGYVYAMTICVGKKEVLNPKDWADSSSWIIKSDKKQKNRRRRKINNESVYEIDWILNIWNGKSLATVEWRS